MSISFRPKPKRFRRGLIGGTGGASSSMPLLKEAPEGRSTVSMTEVVEISFGSDISDFLIDCFRMPGFRRDGIDATVLVLLFGKEVITGVDAAEIGGVGFDAKGPIGDARPLGFMKPGLRGPILGDGRGDWPWDRAGESPPFEAKPGDGRGEGTPIGLSDGFGGGHRPFCSNVLGSSL